LELIEVFGLSGLRRERPATPPSQNRRKELVENLNCYFFRTAIPPIIPDHRSGDSAERRHSHPVHQRQSADSRYANLEKGSWKNDAFFGIGSIRPVRFAP
jgi:hypothetical protein